MDSIRLDGMNFYGYHGVTSQERELGQRFVVDLELRCDLTTPGNTDDLGDTIDYVVLYAKVKSVLEGRSRNLLESLGQQICNDVLRALPGALCVCVTIHKPSVPIPGAILSGAAVTIYREKTHKQTSCG